MKNMISEWYDIIQNYLSLQNLKKDNDKIEWNNITIKNVKKIMDCSDYFQKFYQAYQTFQLLDEKLQKWCIENLDDFSDIMQLTDEDIQVFYERVSLSEVHPEIVQNNKNQLDKMALVLNHDVYIKLLNYLTIGSITEEEICQLDNLCCLVFLNNYSDVDILELLAFSSENRLIYMQEYQSSMKRLLNSNYENIQNMKADNFKILVQMIKERYSDFECFDVVNYSCDYLEELARVYGQSKEEIADFVFHAFPDFIDVSAKGFQNGMIDTDFQEMVEVLMKGKTKEELDHLKNIYFEFLNHSHFVVKELRYQLLTDPRFLASLNREEIMGFLTANDANEYIGKLEMLFASGIYEADKLDALDYKFIKGADEYLSYEEKKEAMRKRIQLVLSPSFSENLDREFIIAQVNECSTFADERKIVDKVLGVTPSTASIAAVEDSMNDMVIEVLAKDFVLCKK